MADPDTIFGVLIQQLQHPVARVLASVAVGLLLTILAIDLTSLLLGTFDAPDWLVNAAALVIAPVVAVIASLGTNRAIKDLSDDG